MRKNLTKAAGAIQWDGPTVVDAWSTDPSDYVFIPFSGGATWQNQSLSLGVSSIDAEPCMEMTGSTNTSGAAVVILAMFEIEESDIIMAGGRSYQFTGHIELESPNSSPWDAQGWNVRVLAYSEPGLSGSLTSVVDEAYPQQSRDSEVAFDLDESFSMPVGTRSIGVTCQYTTTVSVVNPGPKMLWRDFQLEFLGA